mmetsp:Transcript_48171/g.113684  ORF Transcript_48171/g.113684 Transcript_48171/m.113684 type:complete len:229 (+) Transcript_48171:160-846(+)
MGPSMRFACSRLVLLGISTSACAFSTRRLPGFISQSLQKDVTLFERVPSLAGRHPVLCRLRGGNTEAPGAAVAGMSTGYMSRADNFTTSVEEQKDAAALKQKMAEEAAAKPQGSLDDFPACVISPKGTFKYVLIEATDTEGTKKYLVRGDVQYDYHVYAARPTVEALRDQGFGAHVLGGGRLKHSPGSKRLDIYGRSHSFGREDKSITAQVCQSEYPDYTITTSNEGY